MRTSARTIAQDLRNLYEERPGLVWSDDEGVTWLNKNYEHLSIYAKTPVPDKSAHVTLSNKAGSAWVTRPPPARSPAQGVSRTSDSGTPCRLRSSAARSGVGTHRTPTVTPRSAS